jgi:hypothetical protein
MRRGGDVNPGGLPAVALLSLLPPLGEPLTELLIPAMPTGVRPAGCGAAHSRLKRTRDR